MKCSAIVMIVLLLAACAETDPYKRLEPAPADADSVHIANAFNERWPAQFKCVQTVTIDFGIATRTLVGYLIVQRPNRFRLQGMTEQGIKLFDIAGDENHWHINFEAEETEFGVMASIARDIRRVFFRDIYHSVVDLGGGFYSGDIGEYLAASRVHANDGGTSMHVPIRQLDLVVRQVGEHSFTTEYALKDGPNPQYSVRQYDWEDSDVADKPESGFPAPWAEQLPRTIVLRERGLAGPAYKLTIKITEFTVRDKPWPDKIFEREDE